MSLLTALLIAGAVVVLAVVLGVFLLRAQDGRSRSGGELSVLPGDLPSAGFAPRATLVQFSTEFCARCPQVRRLLGEITENSVGVEHVEINLSHRTDLATRYRVLQTPTTFLTDASGAVLARWGGVPDRAIIVDALASIPAGRTQEQR